MSYKISQIDVLTANNGEPLIVGNLTVDGTLSVGGADVIEYFTYDVPNSYFVLSDDLFVAGNVTVDGVFFDSSNTEFAYASADQSERTISVSLGNGVTGQMFQEVYHPLVKNNTSNTIVNGTAVGFTGVDSGHATVEPFIADGTFDPSKFWGTTTEDIAPGALGFVTRFGLVRGIDTSSWATGTVLYASDSDEGLLTSIAPDTPSDIITVGVVITQDANGTIEIERNINPRAIDVPYSNTDSTLVASNLQSAVDELDARKASVGMLASSLTVYPTSTVGDFGYYRLVSSTSDDDYNDTAYDFPTGSITSTDQLLASFVADTGLFVGNPGIITITTVGNIAKLTGNTSQSAEFYFEMYKVDSSNTESLLFASSTTGEVNGVIGEYDQFSAFGLLPSTDFTADDRIVIKYYANLIGTSGATYQFQIGGGNPVRSLLPIPISVIPAYNADAIVVDTSTFGSIILDANADDVQTALEQIDDRVAPHESPTLNNPTYTGTLVGSTSAMNIGSGQLYKSANGNVGINTATPSEKLDIAGNLKLTGAIKGPAIFTIDPSAYGDNTGKVVIAGDLQVDGTTTTINSTEVEIDDKVITIASGTPDAMSANGAGIYIDGADASIYYEYDNDALTISKSLLIVHGHVIADTADFSGAVSIAGISFSANTTTATAWYDDKDIFFKANNSSLLLGHDGDLQLNGESNSSITINGNILWNAGNDGAGSGLDADLLDGEDSTYYLDWTNTTNKPDPNIKVTLTGGVTGNSNVTLTDLANGEIVIDVTVTDDSHSHIIDDIDSLQDELDLKAPLASPALTGIPTAPTAISGTNTTQLATTQFVRTELANLANSAPETLDTLVELADALGNDPNFATTTLTAIGNRVIRVDSTDNAIVRFDGETGQVQNSAVIIDDAGTITTPGNIGINVVGPSERLEVDGNIKLTGDLKGPAVFVIDPSAYGDNTGKVVIAGDLQIDGTTTTINSTELTVDDKNIVLASGAPDEASADGAGITIDGADISLNYSYSSDAWIANKAFNVSNGSIGINTVDPQNSLEVVGDIGLTDDNGNRIRIYKDVRAGLEHILRFKSVEGDPVTNGRTILSIDAPDSNTKEATLGLVIGDEVSDFFSQKEGGDLDKWGLAYIKGEPESDWRDFVIQSQDGWAGSVDYHVAIKLPSGNVGIGIREPEEKLHVVGNTIIDGTTTFTAIPEAPTATTGTANTQISTTEFVETRSIQAEDLALAFAIALG